MHNMLTSALELALWLTLGASVLLILVYLVARARGAHILLGSGFGLAIIFDAEDADKRPIRLLNIGNKFQSVCYTEPSHRQELACMYHQYMAQVLEMLDEANDQVDAPACTGTKGVGVACAPAHKALVIGGGGFSLPKWMWTHLDHTATTVVEIDPFVIRWARRYFFVNDVLKTLDQTGKAAYAEIVCADGAAYVRKIATACEEFREGTVKAIESAGASTHAIENKAAATPPSSFDCIINDAFGGARPLITLAQKEGARIIYQALSEHGVYMANLIYPLADKDTGEFGHVCALMKESFPYVWLIPEAEESPQLTANNVLVAAKRPLPLAARYRI